MVITWYGQSCFRVQSGSTTVVFDPFKKSIGLNPPIGEANMVLVSHDDDDHNNAKSLKGDPFVIDSAGEYEKQGIRVWGIRSFHDNKEGEENGLNTIYTVRMEDMVLCHLGDLGQKKLTDEQLDAIDGVDILMIPVGGDTTIGAEGSIEIINQIEPRIVMPMHYKVKGLKMKLDPVDDFLKEIGQKDVKPQEKLTIKAKDLPKEDDKMEIVVLKL
ncbi:MAG: MBL fold metallo-hydrolase [Candidatus Spechtbacterales bacterium]|nr:MBL fold metallo-hydrolase [Candidatus Spechtbacterales bacterium]